MPLVTNPDRLDRLRGILGDAMERLARTEQSPYR
jgi:hypothetical protein